MSYFTHTHHIKGNGSNTTGRTTVADIITKLKTICFNSYCEVKFIQTQKLLYHFYSDRHVQI